MARVQPHLGIVVDYVKNSEPPFLEKGFYKYLTLLAEKKGMKVTVFSPENILWEENMVLGYRWTGERWKKNKYPLPALIYDRIFYTSAAQLRRLQPLLKRLQKEKQSVLLAKGLPGKWKVYHMLKEHAKLRPYLPETIYVDAQTNWKDKLREHRAIFLKPVSGSHGKGVIKVSLDKASIQARGRTFHNQLFSKTFASFRACERWLRKYIKGHPYVLQPFLTLCTADQTPFDLRLLLQKDEKGRWQETGRVIRQGKKGGLTSNLHGGGTAVEAGPFLQKHFPPAKVDRIEEDIRFIAQTVPSQLEKQHGTLLELGLDLGIDHNQQVWILEVNSKPGRQSFQLTGNRQVFHLSLSAPIRYAQYVSRMSEGV